MTTPDERRHSPLDGLRQCLLDLAQKLAAFWEDLLERVDKITDKLADSAQAKRKAHLRGANAGLKAYLPTEAAPATSGVVSLEPHQDAPTAAEEQLISHLIRWWMKHDPLGATRNVVDAVGLGGAYRLPEGDRLRLAHAFLAMLDIDTAARWPTMPPGSAAALAATMSKNSAANSTDTSRARRGKDRLRRERSGPS
jgi:hypothetical protein